MQHDDPVIGATLTAMIVPPDGLAPVIDILDQAAARLAAKGIEQWPANFAADGGKRIHNLRERAERGEVFLLADRNGTRPLGTVCLSLCPDPDFARFWPAGTVADAVYLYRMAVADIAQGIGISDTLLRLATHYAYGHGKRYLRADCARENTALHDWYRSKGFRRVSTVRVPGRKSGALWEMDLAD